MESRKLGNKGFGAYELLTVAMICLILAFIVLQMALNTREGERYVVFAYDAKVLGVNAVHSQMLSQKDKVLYLSDMIEDGLLTPIKNPFGGEKFCDVKESKVVFDGEDRKIDLRCGNMLIQNHILGADKVQIYEVSSWRKEKEDKNDVERKFYNYQKDGKNVLEEDLEETLFILEVNRLNQKEYQTLEEVKKDFKVQEKTLYRSEKVVKTISY